MSSQTYLLDTHTFLWWVSDDPKLPRRARQLIADEGYDFALSYASVWEMAIKSALGKLTLPSPAFDFAVKQAKENRFQLRPISLEAIGLVEALPQHHTDPFDRILAAECIHAQMPIISADKVFSRYRVKRIWNQ